MTELLTDNQLAEREAAWIGVTRNRIDAYFEKVRR